MRRFLLLNIVLLVLLSGAVIADTEGNPGEDKPKRKYVYPSVEMLSHKVKEVKNDEKYIFNPVGYWTVIIGKIRRYEMDKPEAVDSLKVFFSDLTKYMNQKNIKEYDKSEWIFPVEGYGLSAIGGRNGSGYITSGFDFFDSNSGGHPAHDIFIYDKNQDELDDRTGEFVKVLSMTGGIVLEIRNNWDSTQMNIKGGNIVYIYDSLADALFYYAHLSRVFVEIGDFVVPGSVLGYIGRTGKNAFPKRSPTHLHIMSVENQEGDLIPVDIYEELINSKTIQ